MNYNLMTEEESYVDLYNRIQKQVGETRWLIKRITPMSQKEVEKFQGKTVKKKLLMENLQKELKERLENREVAKELIKQYEQ